MNDASGAAPSSKPFCDASIDTGIDHDQDLDVTILVVGALTGHLCLLVVYVNNV